jgi:hypothetical protein
MASSKKVTRDEWERKLRDVKIQKDRLVMNFLVTEGFVDGANRFRLESGTQRTARLACTSSSSYGLGADGSLIDAILFVCLFVADIDLATITDRMEVKFSRGTCRRPSRR